jgi:TonB family protein
VDPAKVYQPSEIDTQPRRLSGGSAQYPDGAPRMRSGDSVSVSLSFVITEDGEVADIKVTESGGKALDDAVTAAVQKWKYAPGIKKGVKVKVRSGAKQTFRAG